MINLDNVCRIIVLDKKPCLYFEYKPAKKVFNFLIRDEGYYDVITSKKYSKEDLEERGYICEDTEVYNKPCVIFILSNDDKIRKEFNSINEAREYAENIKTKNFINI